MNARAQRQDAEFVGRFVKSSLKNSTAWGESAMPFYALAALFLEQSVQQGLSEALVSNLINVVAAQNGDDVGARRGLPNVYYSAEQLVRLLSGLDLTNLEKFVGFSYSLPPLVDFLARRWRKLLLAVLWPSITRISLLRF